MEIHSTELKTEELERMDKPLRDLIEIIHFTENVSAKIHGLLDEAEIYRTVKEEFAKSKLYNASIFLLTDDGSRLRFVETSLSPEKVKAGEKAIGFRYKSYRIDLDRSSFLSQVVREGKTIEAQFIDVIGEMLPRPLAYLVSKVIGYEKRSGILTPLKRHGKIIGVLVMDSTELARHFIPSVKNLAQHISIALELADEHAERKKAEKELIRLSSAIKMSTDSIVISDIDASIIDVNEATLKMYGTDDKRDLIGKNSFDLIAPEEREKALAGAKEVLEKGYIKGREYHIITKDGSRIPVEMSVAIMKGADGNPIGFVGISRDITERKKIEETLERQRDIAITLSGVGDLSEALNRLFDNLLEIEEFDCAGFYLVDEDTGELDMIVHRGLPDSYVEKVSHFDADSPYAKVVMEGKPIYQKSSDFPPAIRDDLQSEGILAAAAVPIQFEGEVIGDLNMASHTHDEISVPTRHALESIGTQIGEAIVRVRMEEKLRENEKRFRSLAEQSPNMIFINKKGRIVYANKKCEEIMGYKREELYSPDFDFLTLSSSESIDLMKARFSRHMKGKEIAPYEHTLITKEGKKIETILTTKLIRYEGEQAILGIVTDVTDRKRMEDELKRYSEHLEELVRERTRELKEAHERLLKSERLATIGEAAAMVGHDLRNPLQAMVNTLYLLKKKLKSVLITDRKIAEKLGFPELTETLMEQVEYMNKIVSDLQDYARPLKPKPVETSLHQLINSVLSTMTVPETVKVSRMIGDDFPKLNVDPALMKRVFTNLITNALQAMPDGGQLTITTSKKEGNAFISIHDTGVGIPKEHLPKLFHPLFTTKARGQGFGLPVCKRLVEVHDGNITVESNVGKGSTFTVKIPLEREVD